MTFKPAAKVETETESNLSCQAHNCPRSWSVAIGGSKLCSAHAWADPIDWGAITSRINSARISRNMGYQEPMEPMTPDEKRYVLQRLAGSLKSPKDYKAWAHRLKEREERGDRLTAVQQQMWRSVLKVRDDQ